MYSCCNSLGDVKAWQYLSATGEVFPPQGLLGWEHLNDGLALFIIATSPHTACYLGSLCQEHGDVYKAGAL